MASPTTPELQIATNGSTNVTGPDPLFRPIVLAVGLLTLAGGLVVNSVVGPLVFDAIDYPFSDSMRNQTIGLDAAGLLVVAPACLFAAVLAWRGNRIAPILTVCLGSYVAYMFVQYLIGPQFDYYPATLLLHLGLFTSGWLLAIYGWNTSRRNVDETSTPLSSRHAVFAAIIAGFVALRYVPGLVGSVTEDAVPDEVSGDLTMYWLIVVSDLGVFIPIVVVTAAAILRTTPWARPAMTAVVGWFSLVSVAVGAMSLSMILNDDRYASRAQLGLFIITTGLATGYAIHLFKALLGSERRIPSGRRATD